MRPTTRRSRSAREAVGYVVLAVITVGLLATPLLPFVNRPTLWFGLPPIMVWMVVLVVLITPTLAVFEAGRSADENEAGDEYGNEDDEEARS